MGGKWEHILVREMLYGDDPTEYNYSVRWCRRNKEGEIEVVESYPCTFEGDTPFSVIKSLQSALDVLKRGDIYDEGDIRFRRYLL